MKSILTLLLTVAYTFVFSQKVGINNNTPQEALAVKGKIRISDDTTNQSTAGIQLLILRNSLNQWIQKVFWVLLPCKI